MLDKLTQINVLAVLVAGLVSFFLGAVWYMPLFGKLWIRLHGWSDEEVKAKQASMKPAVFFGGMIAAYLAAAFGMAFLLRVIAVPAVHWLDGALVGAVVWLIVAACTLTLHLASVKHFGLYLIDVGFYFVFLMFQGVLLTLWP